MFSKKPKTLSIAFLLLAFTSCNFHTEADMDDMDDMDNGEVLNINYPAAYVVNGESNNIEVLNLNDITHKEQISLNGATFPHHINLSPDKTKLAVAITSTDLSGGHDPGGMGDMDGFKVMVLNSYTGKTENEIMLPKMPHNGVFNTNGSELWIAQEDELQSQVLVYNTGNWSLKNTINVGKGLSEVTFSTDGTKVFAANTVDATVSVIDPSTKMVITTVPVGKDPVGAWPAANGYVYVDNETDRTVTEIDVASGTVTETINLGYKPGYVAYHPAQQELWVSDATNGQIVFYKENNNQWTLQGSIPTGADAHAIAFSHDGATAYVTNQGANTVSVIRVADHTVTATIPVGKKPNGLTIRQ
ncbi:YncE family protein [Adhaeribacter radiodurans]|uniref:YncE family protein n=1 Tax=Adhaeribacter radiodurans TaxID=2745197 RepID=A0A7L7L1R3_9BACT|nr:YncE family protein [Adhaeribacter radiodurans]QMU26535.1 YncE family protein [Adhaeribacter radiodurans]